MSINDRIVQVLQVLDISQQELSRTIGVSKTTISKLTKSGGSIGNKVITGILDHYPQISAEYLCRGEGKAFVHPGLHSQQNPLHLPEAEVREKIYEGFLGLHPISQRIVVIMYMYGLHFELFAERIGVTTSTMAQIIASPSPTSYYIISRVLHSFPEVSAEWLLRGIGPLQRDPEARAKLPASEAAKLISERLRKKVAELQLQIKSLELILDQLQ